MVRPPYYVAVRLCAIADGNWEEFDGYAAGCGVDPFRLRFDRFLNFVYVWAHSRVQDAEMWHQRLMEEPRTPRGPRRSPRRPTPATLQEEADSFVAFMADYRAAGGR